jgi:hypothetical protein
MLLPTERAGCAVNADQIWTPLGEIEMLHDWSVAGHFDEVAVALEVNLKQVSFFGR